jgi:hypothetical protein
MSRKNRIPHTGLPALPTGLPVIPTSKDRGRASILQTESDTMYAAQREAVQNGNRRFGRVISRDRAMNEVIMDMDPELAAQHDPILQHPELDNQRFDGTESEPRANTAARLKYDIEKEKQQDAKELRLGLANAPKFSNTPKPRGP